MFNRGRNQDDFSKEIKAHLELEADQLRSEGLSDKEAYRKARVTFGSAILAEERFHLRHRVIWFDNLLRRAVCGSAAGQEPWFYRRGPLYTLAGHRRVYLNFLCG